MTENLDAYAKESGQDPAEIIKFYQENFKELFPIIDQVSVAGDAINLFKKWENEYSNDGQYSILDALMIFNDLKLISPLRYLSHHLLGVRSSTSNNRYAETASSSSLSRLGAHAGTRTHQQRCMPAHRYTCALTLTYALVISRAIARREF